MCCLFFFQAEDGIRDLVRSRGLGDVYKRQELAEHCVESRVVGAGKALLADDADSAGSILLGERCLLYTSDAADERSSVDLGGRRIIKKKKQRKNGGGLCTM